MKDAQHRRAKTETLGGGGVGNTSKKVEKPLPKLLLVQRYPESEGAGMRTQAPHKRSAGSVLGAWVANRLLSDG